jgi:hypothetical protein
MRCAVRSLALIATTVLLSNGVVMAYRGEIPKRSDARAASAKDPIPHQGSETKGSAQAKGGVRKDHKKCPIGP